VLLGSDRVELGGSEYLKQAWGLVRGTPPAIDVAQEQALQRLLVELASERLMRSAHDCSDGGLATTLAESCFDTGGIGAEVSLAAPALGVATSIARAAALFGESASRVVISTTVDKVTTLLERAAAADVPAAVVGRTGGDRLRIAVGGEMTIDLTIDEAERVWAGAIERRFQKRVA